MGRALSDAEAAGDEKANNQANFNGLHRCPITRNNGAFRSTLSGVHWLRNTGFSVMSKHTLSSFSRSCSFVSKLSILDGV